MVQSISQAGFSMDNVRVSVSRAGGCDHKERCAMPIEQQQMQQPAVNAQKQQEPQYVKASLTRRGPGRITRVVTDLMVFVEVQDNRSFLGLVFKPDKIEQYAGEPLASLNVRLGEILPEIEWDPETFLVKRVVVHRSEGAPLRASVAG
jgi:hypothetical protein